MIQAVLIGLSIFLALEAHDWRRRRREKPEETKSVAEIVRAILPQEKAEFMLPMNEEEFNDHMESQSSRGELLANLPRPWRKSPHPKSPSSDS